MTNVIVYENMISSHGPCGHFGQDGLSLLNGTRVGNGSGDMDSGLRMPGNEFPDALGV